MKRLMKMPTSGFRLSLAKIMMILLITKLTKPLFLNHKFVEKNLWKCLSQNQLPLHRYSKTIGWMFLTYQLSCCIILLLKIWKIMREKKKLTHVLYNLKSLILNPKKRMRLSIKLSTATPKCNKTTSGTYQILRKIRVFEHLNMTQSQS